jgi:hypothetical protein
MFWGSRVQPVHEADNLAADCLENVGFLTSHSATGLRGLSEGQHLLYFLKRKF